MLQPMPKKAPHRHRTLYHVTPTHNELSIRTYGISPLFSNAKTQSVFLVENRRVLWALAHVSARHGIDVGHLHLWRCYVEVRTLKRFNGIAGLWRTENPIFLCETTAARLTGEKQRR